MKNVHKNVLIWYSAEEMFGLVEAFGYSLEDLRWFTINAMKSAFLPFDERLAIIDRVVKPGYAELIAQG